ncbi:MAG: hypothetical protein ACOX7L_01885 [Dethiobacteria bacterium]
MIVYYLALSLIAAMFFLLLAWLRRYFLDISLKLILLLVFWVYLISALLPGLMSFMSPVFALPGAFLLILLGSQYIFITFNGKSGSPSTGEQTESVHVEDIQAEKKCFQKALPPSVRQVAMEVYKPGPIVLSPPLKPLVFPKDPVHNPAPAREQHSLPVINISVQFEGAVLPAKEDLDFGELISAAFRAKDEKNYLQAANVFKTVLAQDLGISPKSLVYSELVSIYKEMGKYFEAAVLIEEFLSESGSELPRAIRLHFMKIVRYLLNLDRLLRKTGHAGLPFSQVPRAIDVEAEKIFWTKEE